MTRIDPAHAQRQAQATHFSRMLSGDFGAFFRADTPTDPTHPASLSGAVFPRLEAMLRQKKQDWTKALPSCPNYFRTIASVITDFSLGEGARFFFPEEDDRTDAFAQWWDAHDLDRVLNEAIAETVATGFSGINLTPTAEGHEPTPNLFSLSHYTPDGTEAWGYNHERPTLHWMMPHPDGTSQPVVYALNFTHNGDQYEITPTAHTVAPNGEWSDPDDALLRRMLKLTPEADITPQRADILPIITMHGPRRGPGGFGRSLYADICNAVQTVAFLDTVATLELQTHFLSKLAIPRSLVTTDQLGRPTVGALEFITFEDDGALPQFIQKDNAFFADLQEHRRNALEAISISTGVPYELLSREGSSGPEKVELALIRQRPFRQVIRSFQRMLRRAIRQIYATWGVMTYGPESALPPLRVLLPDGFQDTSAETRMALLEEFKLGLISHRRYIQTINPDLSEAEAEAIVVETKGD